MGKKALRAAFPYTIPVLMGYLAIGLVFGWMLAAAGYGPVWAGAMSLTIYAGSGQYLGVELLAQAAPLLQTAFLTLMINFRHLVYGLSMLDKFRGMGWWKLYMIFALTDETYALLAGVEPPEGVEGKRFYFCISLLNHLYWIIGGLIGSAAGTWIRINTEGIEFAMTALFLVIAVGQWQSQRNHFPAFLGAAGALVCLLLCGGENGRFLIPTLAVLAAGLLLARPVMEREEKGGSAL